MPARYGEHDCCDVIEAARWARHAGVDPSEWEGKANGYSCPVGVEYGEGHVLLRRFQLKKLAKGRDDLSIRDAFDLVIEYNGDKVTCKNLYVVAAVSCHPSPDDDDNALYHVKLADVRYVLRHYALCVGYNLRETPTGNYQSATTNGGTAWTWAEVNDDIWSNLSAVGGDTPTIVGTPDGTPDELNYYGEYALTAYGSFLDRLAQALCYDPTAGTFSVVKPGAADSAADRAKDKYKKNRLDDAGPIEPVPGRIPSSVRVLFRKEPERAYGNDPYVGVTVADTDPAAGALADSEVILRDDLIADYQGGLLTNLADLQTRATERASAYFRAVKDGASRLNRVYRGALKDFLPGSQHKLVAWRDAGRGTGPQAGVTTEVFRYPPDVTSRWPSTPPLGWRNNEIIVVRAPQSGGLAEDGTAIPSGYGDGTVDRWYAPGNATEGLFDCWAVDINTLAAPTAGRYPTSTFGGFKEGRPVYVVGCCPDGTDVGPGVNNGVSFDGKPTRDCETCGNVLIQTSCGYTDLYAPYKVPHRLRVRIRPTTSAEWAAFEAAGLGFGYTQMLATGGLVFPPTTVLTEAGAGNSGIECGDDNVQWPLAALINPDSDCTFNMPADPVNARVLVSGYLECSHHCEPDASVHNDTIGRVLDRLRFVGTFSSPMPQGPGWTCKNTGTGGCSSNFQWTRVLSLNPFVVTIYMAQATACVIALDITGATGPEPCV